MGNNIKQYFHHGTHVKAIIQQNDTLEIITYGDFPTLLLIFSDTGPGACKNNIDTQTNHILSYVYRFISPSNQKHKTTKPQ